MTSVTQNSEFTLFVTHVDAEGPLLKIWGQIDRNAATCVERMILPLVEQFAQGLGCPGSQTRALSPNVVCCARFQNDGYYRAKICSVRQDGTIVVHFIDYGNVEVLLPDDIRLLDGIPSAVSLHSLPPLAFDFVLANVLPVNGTWDGETVESIRQSLRYVELKGIIHSAIGGHRLLKLCYNKQDFGELLVSKNLAISVTLQEMFRPKYTQPPPLVRPNIHQQPPSRNVASTVSNCLSTQYPQQSTYVAAAQNQGDSIQENWKSPSQQVTPQQRQFTPAQIPEALVFKSRVLDVGSTHDVYVSFVEDGPLKFSVQVQSTAQILGMLMQEVNNYPTQPLQEPPLPGSVCLGRYTQDKVLCRAVVMSVMENKCKVYYVDFGHTEILPYTDIFQLPPQYINPKVLSIRFTLSGLKDLDVTDDMKAYFKKIVTGKSLVLQVRPPEGPPLVQYGDLYDNRKNVKDILKEVFKPSATINYQESYRPPKGTKEVVYVTFVESCLKFFVQLDSGVKSLASIMACLAEYAKTAPPLKSSQLVVGLPCIALYEVDSQWYRAQILSIMGDMVKVLYIDHGNEETVAATTLRVIHNDLVTKLRAQAIKCILNGYQLRPSDQSQTNKFETLVFEKRLTMTVIDILPNGLLIDLFDPASIPIVSIQSQLNASTVLEESTNLILSPQSDRGFNPAKSLDLKNQRSNVKAQPPMTQQQRIKSKNAKTICEDTNDKWNRKGQSESWNQTNDGNSIQDKGRTKTWKEDENEQKRRDNRYQKGDADRFGPPRNDRFSRDGPKSDRFGKNDLNDRYDRHENGSFGRGGNKESRSGRSFGNNTRGDRSSGSDKAWSDKDSDTSSRSSGRRSGKGGGRGGRGRSTKEGGQGGRNQSGRWGDGGNDRNHFKDGRFNDDRNSGDFRSKDRKFNNKDEINKPSKIGTWDSMSTSTSSHKAPPKVFNSQIPPPNITVWAVKNCELVFVNSPTDFYVQLTPDNVELNAIMINIANKYENGGRIVNDSKVQPGMDCVAQYSEDLKWYRAVIKTVDASGATVHFIDYGNSEYIMFDKIKELDFEFTKLPAQAVCCKLFAATKSEWNEKEIENFSNATDGRALEAEFVSRENGIYEVLLREVIDSVPQTIYVNEAFSNGVDLMKAKEAVKNRGRRVAGTSRSIAPDYVPIDSKWTETTIVPKSKEDVIVTWFTNPDNFYCQIVNKQAEFRTMMNEIQKVYIGRQPITDTLQIGSSVIAIFSDDGALYRAKVMELNKLRGHIVQYVDFGNCAMVDQRKIYPVERKFMNMPKQAVHCALKNIAPTHGSSWSNANKHEIDRCFDADKYECTFHGIENDKYMISLTNNGVDVAGTMVTKGLASYIMTSPAAADIACHALDLRKDDANNVATPTTAPMECSDLERVDISLLSGQSLHVKVSSVEGITRFHIQLPSAMNTEEVITAYMNDKDLKVMPRLSCHEVCLGAGCLVNSTGVWRRAVVINCSRTTGFDVRLIDTGAHDEIPLDCMLALPAQLSVMQNQAIECCLRDVPSSLRSDERLKELIEDKDVIIHVEEVENNRLIVQLYDILGNKIKVLETHEDSSICPVCPMPILSSTHKIIVSHANHAGSIWLQRTVDSDNEAALLKVLHEYYSISGKELVPEIGTTCVARSEDNNWYRAKIIEMTDNGACVNFIDYGNSENVLSSALKVLEPQFCLPHQLAIHVSLTVALNSIETEQVEVLHNHMSDKEFTATFYNVNKKWIVELTDENGMKLSDKLSSLGLVKELKKTEVVQPEVQDMVVGGRYEVCLSHADSPAQFWLQRKEEIAIIENMQRELQIVAPSYPTFDGIPEENTLCVAVYSGDGCWYRAEVLDADEDITTVRFVDYGNTDIIDNKSNNIRQIPDSWKTMKKYGIKCRLDVIPVGSEDWSEAACEKFESMLASDDIVVQALVIADSVPRRVELFLGENSIGDTLVQEGFAVMIHNEEDLIDEIVDLELDPHSAFVSHVNSPSEFWVQEEKSVSDLEVMSDRFIVAEMFPKVDEIKEGILCVAKFQDEQWYRARVMSHEDAGTKVRYIDYGNSAVSTEIRAVPEDLAAIPPLSRKCCLPLPEGVSQWSEKACEKFIEMAAYGATIFLLDVLKEGETSIVKLTLDGNDIVDQLSLLCDRQLSAIEERLPPLGEENSPNVVVSHVNSPSEFWTQAESSIVELEEMADRLVDAKSFLPLNTFEKGTICAGKFPEDDQWYRAKILSHDESGTEVLYVDYGNSAVSTELRMLPEDIVNIPSLSRCCALRMPADIDAWSEAACEKFVELVADGATMFQFEILDDEEPAHIALNLEGEDIVNMLIPLCDRKVSQTHENKVIEIVKEAEAEDENQTMTTIEATEGTKAAAVEVTQDIDVEPEVETIIESTKPSTGDIENGDIDTKDKGSSTSTSSCAMPTIYVQDKESEAKDENQTITTIEATEGTKAAAAEVTQDIDVKPEVETVIESTKPLIGDIENEDNDGKDEGSSSLPASSCVVSAISVQDVTSSNTVSETGIRVSTASHSEIETPVKSSIVQESSTRNGLEERSDKVEIETNESINDSTVQDHKIHGTEQRDVVDVATELTVDDIVGNMVKIAMNYTEEEVMAQNGSELRVQDSLQSREHDEQVMESTTGIDIKLPKTPKIDKIVPGSISCGLLQEEIIFNLTERRNSIPLDDKIVPGSINKGNDLSDNNSLESNDKELSAEPLAMTEAKTSQDYVPIISPRISHAEKIVPGSISRGESPNIESAGPPTPKTPHAEKLVAGVVNPQDKLSEFDDEDEVLTVIVENDIPKYAA